MNERELETRIEQLLLAHWGEAPDGLFPPDIVRKMLREIVQGAPVPANVARRLPGGGQSRRPPNWTLSDTEWAKRRATREQGGSR